MSVKTIITRKSTVCSNLFKPRRKKRAISILLALCKRILPFKMNTVLTSSCDRIWSNSNVPQGHVIYRKMIYFAQHHRQSVTHELLCEVQYVEVIHPLSASTPRPFTDECDKILGYTHTHIYIYVYIYIFIYIYIYRHTGTCLHSMPGWGLMTNILRSIIFFRKPSYLSIALYGGNEPRV